MTWRDDYLSWERERLRQAEQRAVVQGEREASSRAALTAYERDWNKSVTCGEWSSRAFIAFLIVLVPGFAVAVVVAIVASIATDDGDSAGVVFGFWITGWAVALALSLVLWIAKKWHRPGPAPEPRPVVEQVDDELEVIQNPVRRMGLSEAILTPYVRRYGEKGERS